MTRKNPPKRDSYLLFSKSAGICNLCKEYKPLIVEQTHIIAHSPNGPRGNIPYSGNKDSYDNLILLCPNCHTEVDDCPERYPVSFLREIKFNHEDDIKNKILKETSISSTSLKLNDVWVIKCLIEYGYLYSLNRFITMLPKTLDMRFYYFLDTLNELKEQRDIYPLNDEILQFKLGILEHHARKLDYYISGYVEYNGRIYNNFDSATGEPSKVHRLREGLRYDWECQIDNKIKNIADKFLQSHDLFIKYIREKNMG